MIFEAIILAICGLFSFVGDSMPEMDLPAWVDALNGHVATISAWAAPMGNWLPFGAMRSGVTFVMLCLGISFLVKIVRIVASFMTAGGGSAA